VLRLSCAFQARKGQESIARIHATAADLKDKLEALTPQQASEPDYSYCTHDFHSCAKRAAEIDFYLVLSKEHPFWYSRSSLLTDG
jgi:hypothetical protein